MLGQGRWARAVLIHLEMQFACITSAQSLGMLFLGIKAGGWCCSVASCCLHLSRKVLWVIKSPSRAGLLRGYAQVVVKSNCPLPRALL